MTPPNRKADTVLLLNPSTCGIYKNGGKRYKVDHVAGKRTSELDNELGEYVDKVIAGERPPGTYSPTVEDVFSRRILVPRYYDERWVDDFRTLIATHGLHSVSLGDLEDSGIISVDAGHGSPSNDMRGGHIPYVKVSDVRSLRINVNPTNLVSRAIAEAHWGGKESGLRAWDLVTPNRASSNIGEFALLLPGEEERVLTKEFFIIRVQKGAEQGWSWAYLLWALCLKSVRKQWQRIALMQTNREDVGGRYREILLPSPRDKDWAERVSAPFREYFVTLAESRTKFVDELSSSGFDYIASVRAVGTIAPVDEPTPDGGTGETLAPVEPR